MVKLGKCGENACGTFSTMIEMSERMLKMLSEEEKEHLITALGKVTFGLTKQQVMNNNITDSFHTN